MKIISAIKLVTCVACAICFVACREWHENPELKSIDSLASTSPDSALSRLKCFDKDTLNEADRHLYDLLSVKAADKAYITHTSDSVITEVIKYYSRHKDYGRYGEALYYGGRVNSDIGDYPTALRYFQEALEELPHNGPGLELRLIVLSQTGRLLNSMKLHKEAIRYLKESVSELRIAKDTLGLVEDLQQLGSMYMRDEQFDSAYRVLNEAHALSEHVSDNLSARIELYFAQMELDSGNLSTAYRYIKNALPRLTDSYRCAALVCGSEIYLKIGKLDTAYLYSDELVHAENTNNKRFGYKFLLTTELKRMIPDDSLDVYIERFANETSEYMSHNGDRNALIQNTMYNYALHEKAKMASDLSRVRMEKWVLVSFAVVLCLVSLLFILKYRSAKRINELTDIINHLRRFSENLTEIQISPSLTSKRKTILISSEEENLREKLRAQLLSLYRQHENAEVELDSRIRESCVYSDIQQLINDNKCIVDSDDTFIRLEELIEKVSPNFKRKINLLTGGRLSNENYRMTLLLKCQIPPSKIAQLVSREKNSISSRRRKLCRDIFDEDLGPTVYDGIIRFL